MGRRHWATIGALALTLALPLTVHAEEPSGARRAPVIWYRASQQCPSEADFMAKFANNAVQPKLAAAGDHVDFLVTLVDSGSETVGRLERQTHAGTVAIRELSDASCARVAEGLALSLGLALEPGQAVSEEPPSAAPPRSKPIAEPTPPASTTAPAPSVPPEQPAPAVVAPPPMRRGIAIGATGGILFGLSPQPMARSQAFVELDPVLPRLSSRFSLRAGAVGAIGSADTRIGSVERWLFGGYIEGCPYRVGNERFSLRPCLGFELGSTGARSGGNGLGDGTLWATPGVALRASARLPYRLGLEAGAGVQVPLLRSEIFVGPASLYRAEIVLFQATLGISFGLP